MCIASVKKVSPEVIRAYASSIDILHYCVNLKIINFDKYRFIWLIILKKVVC